MGLPASWCLGGCDWISVEISLNYRTRNDQHKERTQHLRLVLRLKQVRQRRLRRFLRFLTCVDGSFNCSARDFSPRNRTGGERRSGKKMGQENKTGRFGTRTRTSVAELANGYFLPRLFSSARGLGLCWEFGTLAVFSQNFFNSSLVAVKFSKSIGLTKNEFAPSS
jgi:hypothetical protein